MSLIIRQETPADVERIEAVTIAAFLDAPHCDHTEQFIVAALRDAQALSISLVAQRQGEVVGHVAVSAVTLSDGATGWFGLGPISVMPERQRSGIGSALMERMLATLQVRGAAGCVLLGDPAFYRRFGFKPEPGLLLPGVPAEYFLALRFAGSIPQGQVTYHDAFNATA